jgi:IS5 family transposase
MGQRGFWDAQDRINKLHNKKPILKVLTEKVPWDAFAPLLDQAYEVERKSPAGRKRIDPLILFKMLILQQLFNLSDNELEFQVNDRRSFEEFIGLGLMDSIPDATTVAFFRERLRKAGLIEELFDKFENFLRDQGLEAKVVQIIDATIIPVPIQRNSREENNDIKEGKTPEEWEESPERLHQKDLDARWTKKNGKSYYGYKNGISIDVEHGIIRRYKVVPANVHDSQLLSSLLDPENTGDVVWGDSAFAGKSFAELLEVAGYESSIHEKGSRFNPLDDDARQRNKAKSKIRAKVEHVFGGMVTWMKGKLTLRIGLPRTNAWWGLRNLTFNLIRYTQICSTTA